MHKFLLLEPHLLGRRIWWTALIGMFAAISTACVQAAVAGDEKTVPNESGAGKETRAAAEADWIKLRDMAQAGRAARPRGQAPTVNWKEIAVNAQTFQRNFPEHAQARAAGKIAADALIRADDDSPELSSHARAVADAYVDDPKNPARDRLEVKIVFEQAKLRRATFANEEQRLLAHTAHARELIRLYPDQPEGFGYLLSQAKTESTRHAHRLADELLASNAPETFKQGAQRVIDRLKMVGRPLELRGAETALAAARGKALVVYTWRVQDDGFLEIINRLGKTGDTVFIGVNLDADAKQARVKASSLKLPGTQFYDGGGLDGPLARQLHLIMGASLYLIGSDGVVRDVNGHIGAPRKLVQLVLDQEGRP